MKNGPKQELEVAPKPYASFNVKNAADGVGEIYIYGDIEDMKWYEEDVVPTEIKEQVDALEGVERINVYVNSPGGSVFAGIAIFNILRRSKAHVTAYVDGLAASIASLIVLAADEVVIPTNALFMIHNPWIGRASGEAGDLRQMADRLDRVKDVLITTYQEKTTLNADALSEMMDKETWLNGQEAKNLGFADSVTDELAMAAKCEGDKFFIKDGVTFSVNDFKNFKKDLIQVSDNGVEPEDEETQALACEIMQKELEIFELEMTTP